MENFSESRLKELKAAFNIFDTDGDGIISKEELQSIFLRLGNTDLTDSDIDEIIKYWNPNGDKLEFEHFVMLFIDRKENKNNEMLFEAFKIFGKSNSGNLSMDQLKYLIYNYCFSLSKHEKDTLIAEFGNSESINFDTFLNVFKLF
jgi:Ca2+-binding EF-hand superfamily protein